MSDSEIYKLLEILSEYDKVPYFLYLQQTSHFNHKCVNFHSVCISFPLFLNILIIDNGENIIENGKNAGKTQ